MLLLVQLVAIVGVFALTYLFFRAIGPRRDTVIYTPEERDRWNQSVSGRLG